jgi:hypothetical protein
MRTTLLFASLLVVGCGGSGSEISVGQDSFTVRDEGYFYSDGHDYCANGGNGQMMLSFVDFNYICDPTHPQDKAPNSPHLQLDIILTQGPLPDHLTHPNMGLPYDSTPGVTPNCETGSGDVIVARIVHLPDGNAGTVPDRIQYATSAHLQFTSYDATKAKPNTGNYDLKFGSSEVKGSFTIAACN